METSKDKAKGLVQKHYNKIQEVTAGFFDDDAPTHDLVYRAAKQCAKIAVQEIIKEIDENYETLHSADRKVFYNDVLKEIDKL